MRIFGKPGDGANAAHRHVGGNVGWMKQSGRLEIVIADELDDDAIGIAET
jgi:hypothetical protein